MRERARVPPWEDRNVTRVDTRALTRRRSAAVQRIGEYELIREIGSGGMGSVWQAKRVTLGGAMKLAAVKLMSRELNEKPEAREMFVAEARLSMLLNYRNVVQVFDAGEADGQCYLVMEWVDGMNLAQLVGAVRSRGIRISYVLTAYIIGEILRGLAYAQTITHEGAPLGIVHRDVSPQNVLVSVSGEVKLTDFGVARLASDETSGHHAPGKLRYMAPEQLRGKSRDPAVDLYAVGAMLHELIDGRKFRDAVDDAHLAGLVLEGVVPPLQDPQDVPRELDALRKGLLEADPGRRIARAKQALQLLTRWPGYRDASVELTELVRSYMGVSAPRSGVHAKAAVVTPSGERTHTAIQRDPSASGPAAVSSVTEVDVPASLEPAPSAAPYPVGLVVALTGALVAAVGVGGFALWHATRDSEPVAAAREVAPLEQSPPVAAPTPASQPPASEAAPSEPEPEPTEPTEPQREPEPAPAPAPAQAQPEPAPTPAASSKSATPKPTATKPKGKAEVTFKTGDFTFVWVKVKGRVLALEPLKKVELPSGRHRVFFRQGENDEWKSAGRITIEPDRAYEVRMEKPGRVALQAL